MVKPMTTLKTEIKLTPIIINYCWLSIIILVKLPTSKAATCNESVVILLCVNNCKTI